MTKRILSAFDIGSSKITCVIAEHHVPEVDPNNPEQHYREPLVKGFATLSSTGVIKGTIRDVNSTSREIKAVADSAHYACGLEARELWIALGALGLEGVNSKGQVTFAGEHKRICEEDIEELKAITRPANLKQDYKIIQTLIQSISVDEQKGDFNPIGLYAKKLELNAHVVTAPTNILNTYSYTLEKSGVTQYEHCFSIAADAEALLTKDEKDAGTVLINFGAGSTQMGIFKNGGLVHSKIIPIGSSNYDNDIKEGLSVSREEAERIKKIYGKAWQPNTYSEDDELMDICRFGRKEFEKVAKWKLFEIMNPRTEELGDYIEQELFSFQSGRKLVGGIVTTGGGSQIRELNKFLHLRFDLNVRSGFTNYFPTLSQEYRGPAYSTILGTVLYASKNPSLEFDDNESEGWSSPIKGWIRSVKNWFIKEEHDDHL